MTRCDYDALFYRVFCVTLLAIAFTFTIILTNVFIDIDGLLAKKHGGSNEAVRDDLTVDTTSTDDVNYADNEDTYRNKRSIESQNFLFHIKNPKVKNILTNRLTNLLEALDAEESHNVKINKKTNLSKEQIKDSRDVVTVFDVSKEDEKLKRLKDDDILHLTMHNILLQGIIGHMSMKDVYERINILMRGLNHVGENNKDTKKNQYIVTAKPDFEETKVNPKKLPESRLIAELLKCRDDQEPIKETDRTEARKTTFDVQNVNLIDPKIILRSNSEDMDKSLQVPIGEKEQQGKLSAGNKISSNVLVKTVIDIKSVGNDRNVNASKNNVRGIMELIYNGKSMKFSRPDTDLKPNLQKKSEYNMKHPKFSMLDPIQQDTTPQTDISKINANDLKKIPQDYLNRFVGEYFKHFPKVSKEVNEELQVKNETKRIKRHVKVKSPKVKKMFLPAHQKVHTKNGSDDDDLYVEIETHFDNKGMKGEKKKKLIKNLIEKIQKAINSTDTKKPEPVVKKKKTSIWRVRKRIQNPLEFDDKIMINKISLPMNAMLQRQLNPITILKTIPKQDSSISVRDKSGDSWKKQYIGPTFLAGTKAINSAEMSELDVDYKNVLNTNGIPQRLQKPLNTDMSQETMNPGSFYDLGNMKFLVKDIDGAGFIAYNQYSDEPPDPEITQLFSGFDNVIKPDIDERDQEMDVNWLNEDKNTSINKDDHIILRRSIDQNHDFHPNEYKIIFDGNALPYNNYRDIYQREAPKHIDLGINNNFEQIPLIIDENIFDKNLKPSEIFGLANLFRRKKRSINVKKISNLNSKIKLNRYLNTKAMSRKAIFLNKKRNKRQVNKIRIIASDYPHKHSSDENVYVVADEDNVFADRAIVKDMETSEMDHEKHEEAELIPYHPDFQDDTPTYRIFDGKSRHNALMSKYPHVFMEEITRSKEDFGTGNALLFRKIPSFTKVAAQTMEIDKDDDKTLLEPEIQHFEIKTETTDKIPKVQDIVNELEPPKPNFKVTLKITPKNMSTNVPHGFKEIHTSINKKFNKNGLQYLSLVNVSEISKVTKLNKTKDFKDDYSKLADLSLVKRMSDQQDKMQLLLREHQKNIDEQLNRLNEEKVKVESILIDDNNTSIPHCDYLDSIMQGKAHKHPPKEEEMLREPTTVSTTSTTSTTTTTTTTTTAAPTTQPETTASPPVFNEKLKKKILHTIERNENLTDQILKKIDKNTEILQSFLKKLTDRIDATRQPEYKIYKEEEKTEKPLPNFNNYNNFANDWRPHPAPISFSPNYFIRRNDSHMSIPFVYAYQQPIAPHKVNTPVASVVYHGHIHTNTIHPRDTASIEKEKHKAAQKMGENNQTRFFIDEIESDYKVIPMNMKSFKIHKNATIML